MAEYNEKEKATAEQEEEFDTEESGNALKSARSFVLILLIGILCCYTLMSNLKNTGQSLPMFGGKGMAVVMTGSMEPELPVDSVIFVEQADSYKVGDVVVIQDYYNLIVHRIIEINPEEGTVITKGDANNAEDDPSELTQIRGIVTGYVPYVGVIVRIMKTPLGSLSLIGVALLLYVLSGRKKDGDEDDEEDDEE